MPRARASELAEAIESRQRGSAARTAPIGRDRRPRKHGGVRDEWVFAPIAGVLARGGSGAVIACAATPTASTTSVRVAR